MKLNEIGKIERLMPEEVKSWLYKRGWVDAEAWGGYRLEESDRLRLISDWIKGWERGDVRELTVSGGGETLDWPLDIGELSTVSLHDFRIVDYVNFPTVKDELTLLQCEVVNDPAVPLTNISSTCSVEILNTKLTMETALSIVDYYQHAKYDYYAFDGPEISIRKSASGSITYEWYTAGGGGETRWLDDIFDVQEALIKIPDIEKVFK